VNTQLAVDANLLAVVAAAARSSLASCAHTI
jgi:hypothetical protein